MAAIDTVISGVFATMVDRRKFEVHLANCQSWSSKPDGVNPGEEGWLAAGRMVMY